MIKKLLSLHCALGKQERKAINDLRASRMLDSCSPLSRSGGCRLVAFLKIGLSGLSAKAATRVPAGSAAEPGSRGRALSVFMVKCFS